MNRERVSINLGLTLLILGFFSIMIGWTSWWDFGILFLVGLPLFIIGMILTIYARTKLKNRVKKMEFDKMIKQSDEIRELKDKVKKLEDEKNNNEKLD